jgi:lipopolysaccharide export system permease protein
MIFQRAARREFAQAAAGIFVAIFAILISTQLIRLLGDAASGRLAPDAVAVFLAFTALNYMPVLLSLTVFMAVLLSLSRSYRDSEMVVWSAVGLPLHAWVRPVLVFAAPILLAVALLSLFLTPWVVGESAQFRERLDARSEIGQISPGAFHEAKRGDQVVFVEAMSQDISALRNVFVTTRQQGRLGVVTAASGHQEVADNGDKFMVLENGRRYEVEPGTPEFKIMTFERYALRLENRAVQPADLTSPRAMPLWELVLDERPTYRAELLWRLGLPISAMLLALLAIPLSFVNPRAGRSANLIMAILVYAIYSNLLSVSEAWVAQGKLSFAVGLMAVHLLMLGVLVLGFWRRTAVRWPRWLRR